MRPVRRIILSAMFQFAQKLERRAAKWKLWSM